MAVWIQMKLTKTSKAKLWRKSLNRHRIYVKLSTISNVRLGSEADSLSIYARCPLSGVKRTSFNASFATPTASQTHPATCLLSLHKLNDDFSGWRMTMLLQKFPALFFRRRLTGIIDYRNEVWRSQFFFQLLQSMRKMFQLVGSLSSIAIRSSISTVSTVLR